MLIATGSQTYILKDTAMMDDEARKLRLECLKLAVTAQLGDPVEEAARYFNFIFRGGALTPREAINSALDAAGVQ